jgi:hypothetical protein
MSDSSRRRKGRVGVVVFVVSVLSVLLLWHCGEEECLVWGENCTQDYKQENYGTTDIQCCSGQCTDHGSGILTCGS